MDLTHLIVQRSFISCKTRLNKMNVELVILTSCVALACCQSTISFRDDTKCRNECFEDVKIEMTQQKAVVCNDRQAMLEMKSEIRDIRQSLSEQSQMLETLRDKWHEIAICPRGFTYLPLAGSCYKVVYESHNWTSAGKTCRELDRGSHLVAITSSTENSALKTFLTSELSKNIRNSICTPRPMWSGPFPGNLFWTSGQRQIENNCRSPFVWKTMSSRNEILSVGFIDWLKGEPNCNNNREFCFHIWPLKNFTWNDEWCNTQMCPLCEYTP